MKNEEYVTKKVFCEFIGKSRNTLENWLKDGLPCVQPGGRGNLLIPKFKAAKWIDNETPENVAKLKEGE